MSDHVGIIISLVGLIIYCITNQIRFSLLENRVKKLEQDKE